MKYLLLFILININFLLNSLQLELNCDYNIGYANELYECKLIIKGEEVYQLFKDLPYYFNPYNATINHSIPYDSNKPNEFIHIFNIKPDKTGDITVGPIELAFQNQLLKSNIIKIKVYENISNDNDLTVLSDKDEININKPCKVLLTYDSKFSKEKFSFVEIKKNKHYLVTILNSRGDLVNKNQFIIKINFELIPFEKKDITINSNELLFFNNKHELSDLSDDIKVNEISIKVK